MTERHYMSRNRYLTTVFFLIILQSLHAQETDYGHGFHTILVNNPAYAGIGEGGTMRLSYLNFYPGNGYNFHSVYFSCDSYFKMIHGAAGFYLSDDYLGGIVNDLRGGLCYSYFLQAGKELYVNAGLSATFFHRGFDFSGAVFPDMIDQMGAVSLPTSENLSDYRKTLFDVNTGFLIIFRNFYGGIGISQLTQPDISESGAPADRIRRKYFINIAGDYLIDKKNNLRINPVAALEIQGDYLAASTGAVFKSTSLSASTLFFLDNFSNIDFQAGFSIRRNGMAIIYNYKFSLKSGSTLMPFSLMHQVGLLFTINNLNNVKKSAGARTINIPEL